MMVCAMHVHMWPLHQAWHSVEAQVCAAGVRYAKLCVCESVCVQHVAKSVSVRQSGPWPQRLGGPKPCFSKVSRAASLQVGHVWASL